MLDRANKTWFERAIFLSWFCAKPSCKFCFMYTIKDQIRQPKKARRRLESILAEALICKICSWQIGFISAGIASWKTQELKEVIEGLYKITGKKQWLNLGIMNERQINELLPFVEGVTGTVECVNKELRNDIVPDKPLDKIEDMFKIADKYGIKKSITIIIGLGETIDDFPKLVELIDKWKVDRINLYRLIPHDNTPFTKGPSSEYYASWIAMTRHQFPKLQIIAGSWPDKTKEIALLLKSGANAVTKFPAIKLFGTSSAKQIEEGAKTAGREFIGTLTEYPDVDIDEELNKLDFGVELKQKIKKKYLKYYKKLKRHDFKV